MKTLYLECNMGASGDMLLSALAELTADADVFIKKLNAAGLGGSGVSFVRKRSVKCGISGTHIDVVINGEVEQEGHEHDHEHHGHGHEHHEHGHGEHHRSGIDDIEAVINGLNIPHKVRDDAIAVYKIIAEAEAHVHGKPVDKIHFHEVGTLDAIADITGVCMAVDVLRPEKIISSPVNTGFGFVSCAHGTLPVPAPATARIIQGMPVYAGKIKGELLTPTGAALLKHFAEDFGEMPVITIENIGYGMGNKDFAAANCVRAFIGRGMSLGKDSGSGPNDEIAELSCNLDDMTGEETAYAINILLENGALDAYTVPAQMKKGRPGFVFVCLCRTQDADSFARLILKHTTSFGVRSHILKRYILDRGITSKDTPYGTVRVKSGEGYGTRKSKPEYCDAALAAKTHGMDLPSVLKNIRVHEV